MKQVLITRTAERAAPLIGKLAELGITAHAMPVTQTNFIVVEARTVTLSEFAWLAFTSVNGVRGLHNCLRVKGRELPPEMRIACVGKATAAEATALFHAPDMIATDSSGAGLAREMLAHMKSDQERILWACSTTPRPEFAREQLEHRVNLTSLPVYETVALPAEKIRAKYSEYSGCAVVVFAAPSAVRAFIGAVGINKKLIYAVIGATTAEAARAAGCERIVVSASPEPKAVAQSINEALESIES